MTQDNVLSWKTYAQQYDLLLSYNPYYQQLREEVLSRTSRWDIGEGDCLIDLGAGTGNYSVPLARQFPSARVVHIDSDPGMNAEARTKKEQAALSNLTIRQLGVESVDFEQESIQAVLSVHALYTFPQPQEILKRIYRWLEPGGQAILVDAGRFVNVLSWQWALGTHLLGRYGLRKTYHILKESREVSRQNAYIRDLQRQGVFWTHTHREFCDAVEDAGFTISDAFKTFRGISDFVVAEKAGKTVLH